MGQESERLARELQTSLDSLIALVEGLTEEQWRRPGKNFPEQLNGEDERRPVGVIAHHVAYWGPGILERTQAIADGRQPPPAPDFNATNAEHAREHAGTGKDEVLAMLRRQREELPAGVRAIPDESLEIALETPAGRLTVAQRIERVLIGHVRMHQGSIEAAIA